MTNETTPPSATAFNDALALFNAGNWAGALARVDEALAQDPVLELAYLLRARCLVRLNEWMPAREAFAQTLRINAGNYSAWLEAGHLCKQMGELKQAAMSYQRAIDVAPERYEALLGMARVMLLLGELPNARSLLASAAGRNGEVDETLARYRELAAEEATPGAFASSAAMSSLYTDKLSPATRTTSKPPWRVRAPSIGWRWARSMTRSWPSASTPTRLMCCWTWQATPASTA